MSDTGKNVHYTIRKEPNTLIFETSHYTAEKSSVLHGGVYTKEFSSILLASALTTAVYIVLNSAMTEMKLLQIILLLVSFTAAFVGSRTFIFKEKIFRVFIDRSEQSLTLTHPGFFGSRTEAIPFRDVQSVETGTTKFIPENEDAIQFVQKISLQHGSAAPELSETEEFVTLSLKLSDGSSRLIYAARVDEEPPLPADEIHSFLFAESAQA